MKIVYINITNRTSMYGQLDIVCNHCNVHTCMKVGMYACTYEQCIFAYMYMFVHYDIWYGSISQPVVRRPLVVRSHLSGGPQARPSIYLTLRENMQKEKILKFIEFFSFQTQKRIFVCTVIDYKTKVIQKYGWISRKFLCKCWEILWDRLKNFSALGSAKALDGLGGPRTETKFTKWFVSLKRLRTAVIRPLLRFRMHDKLQYTK